MTDKEYEQFDYPMFVDCLRAGANDSTLLMDMLHSSVGMSGETGELLDHMKKAVWQEHKVDFKYIMYELGDILFYLQFMCNCLGTSLDTVRKMNIEKLQKRYPNRKFEKERSINRDE